MRTVPEDRWGEEEIESLNAEPWQIELLNLNPEYSCWGPYEDYMITKGDGWNSAKFFDSWKDFGPWNVDELNEIVHFYFQIDRDSEKCSNCVSTGYHPDALWISESFYKSSSPFCFSTAQEMVNYRSDVEKKLGNDGYPPRELFKKYGKEFEEFCDEMVSHDSWDDRITQDELNALIKENRIREKDGENLPTLKEVNRANKTTAKMVWDLNHDAINKSILVSRRCERLGVPRTCPDCSGRGYVYTAPSAHINLVLWYLHPRKGCSRGIEVKNIQQNDLPAVYKLLNTAAERNAERFKAITSLIAV